MELLEESRRHQDRNQMSSLLTDLFRILFRLFPIFLRKQCIRLFAVFLPFCNIRAHNILRSDIRDCRMIALFPAKRSSPCVLSILAFHTSAQMLAGNRVRKHKCQRLILYDQFIRGSCAFSFRENIVIYVDMDLFGGSTEDITEKLIYFIRDSFLKLSLSYTVTGHMYLRKQYLQALAAHELGNAQKPYLWIHAFRDFALPYIFSQAIRQIPGSMLCHEKLLLLQAHDKEQGTEYMRTLEVYLKNHLNAVQSARELYIHRSTFLYRLERIRALLDSDLTDYDELLYLMISFYLLKEDQPKRQDDSQ